ncbi:hypothetical protein SAMN02910456_02702 [Ruminococcaceae bacterium YRB3002]|nr:hypothetical protein SAMN02910456_02702 [Ruminococcaceae bacterium YRB3002]
MKYLSYTRLIVVAILGIACIIFGAREMIWLAKPAIDLNDPEVAWSELKEGDHVKMDIYYLFDPVCSTDDDSVTYFAMPRIVSVDDQYSQIADFIAVDVNNKDLLSSYNALSEATIDWWLDDDATEIKAESIPFEGVVRKMTKDPANFMTEYVKDLGYDQAFIDNSACELGLFPAEKGAGSIIMVVIGAVVFLFGAGLIVVKLVTKK